MCNQRKSYFIHNINLCIKNTEIFYMYHENNCVAYIFAIINFRCTYK